MPIPDTIVRLEKEGLEIAQAETDAAGNYRVRVLPESGTYNLAATAGTLGSWHLGLRLCEGKQHAIDLTLTESISIEGTLLMLDDATPHVAVPVEVIPYSSDQPIETTLSDSSGKYRFVNLKPGGYRLRCQVLGGYVDWDGPKLVVEPDKTLNNIDFRLAHFKKGTWQNYTAIDGLAYNTSMGITSDAQGSIWVATTGGASQFDGKQFTTFTTKHGLISNNLTGCECDQEGNVWFTAGYAGVSYYNGENFVNIIAHSEALPLGYTRTVYSDPEGGIWFGGFPGIVTFTNKQTVTYFKPFAMSSNVHTIRRAPNGSLWMGTTSGVIRYDGEQFTHFTTVDGLAHNGVYAIHCDGDGTVWFGTFGGVSCYDGERFISLTTKDGLVHDQVWTIYRDPDGVFRDGRWSFPIRWVDIRQLHRG